MLRIVESGVLYLVRYEMTLGNLNLLLGDVTAHLDELHTVEQRARYGVEVVCRGDEQYLGEVEVHVKIVVVERVVLLRIEHLKQSRRRVTVHSVLRNLVYLVENEHRI